MKFETQIIQILNLVILNYQCFQFHVKGMDRKAKMSKIIKSQPYKGAHLIEITKIAKNALKWSTMLVRS